MNTFPYILLADDDMDDCRFFREALEALPFSTSEKAVNDGEELMQLLTNTIEKLPHVLFMDLNMPRKNGFQCLIEIKNNARLEKIPVVMISTSYDPSVAEALYQNGASYYIKKPIGFSQQQELISLAIQLITEKKILRPTKENFLLGTLHLKKDRYIKKLERTYTGE